MNSVDFVAMRRIKADVTSFGRRMGTSDNTTGDSGKSLTEGPLF
jgi:hypothetical protein